MRVINLKKQSVHVQKTLRKIISMHIFMTPIKRPTTVITCLPTACTWSSSFVWQKDFDRYVMLKWTQRRRKKKKKKNNSHPSSVDANWRIVLLIFTWISFSFWILMTCRNNRSHHLNGLHGANQRREVKINIVITLRVPVQHEPKRKNGERESQ